MEEEGNRSSSDTTCSLSLEYSSSLFEWSDYRALTEADDVYSERGSSAMEPYQYEPEASESESSEKDSSSEDNERRLGNTAW